MKNLKTNKKKGIDKRSGVTLTISEDAMLKIPKGIKLINQGTIAVCGKIVGIVVGNKQRSCK